MKKLLLGAVVVLLTMVGASYALSPWTSQPITIAPLQGTAMSCTSVVVSSITSTQLLAANPTRMSLFIENTSSQTISALYPRQPVIIISSYTLTGQANVVPGDLTNLNGVLLPPSNWQALTQSTYTFNSSARIQMDGGSVWQGAIYGMSEGTATGRVNVCELNP